MSYRRALGNKPPFSAEEQSLLVLLASPEAAIAAQGLELLRGSHPDYEDLLKLVQGLARWEGERAAWEDRDRVAYYEQSKTMNRLGDERDAMGAVLLQVAGRREAFKLARIKDHGQGYRPHLPPQDVLKCLEIAARALRKEIKRLDAKAEGGSDG